MASEDQINQFIANPGPILTILGRVAVSYSRQAFQRQRFGSTAWPVRYPGQQAPILNIAGALSDFNAGRTAPLANRFENTPAAINTGKLRDSVETQAIVTGVSEPYAEVGVGGAANDYAAQQNFGLASRQDVTAEAKSNIAAFINSSVGQPYTSKLRPLLKKDTLVTDINERQFIGVNQELERLLAATVEEEAERINVNISTP